MNLLPYQSKAIAGYSAHRRAGKRRILFIAPTGSGKTVILSRLNQAATSQGKRCMWLVNRRELVHQTVRTLARFGVEAGALGRGLGCPTQVVTYQGALSAGEVPPADVVFCDEAHHLAGRGDWIQILKAYPEATIVGATATPERGDGQGLEFFEEMVVVAQPYDLVELWEQSGGKMGLVPCHVERPNRELDGLARTPAKATILHRLKDHQQVCFAPHLTAAESYVAGYREIGLSCEMVTGTTEKDERDAILARFAARQTRVLVNCQVLTEGWDCPEVDVITLAGKCSTIGSMIQKTGRGARPAPGKTRFVVLDLFGVTWTLGHPFEDRVYSLTGKGISSPKAALVRLSLCKRCGDTMPEDGDTCAREGCGWTRPALEVPRALEERLEKWEYRRTQTHDDRVANMVRWIRAARGRGQTTKATAIAIHTYQGWYHTKDVPRAVISQAMATVSGVAWCARCEHSVKSCRCIVTSDAETGT